MCGVASRPQKLIRASWACTVPHLVGWRISRGTRQDGPEDFFSQELDSTFPSLEVQFVDGFA